MNDPIWLCGDDHTVVRLLLRFPEYLELVGSKPGALVCPAEKNALVVLGEKITELCDALGEELRTTTLLCTAHAAAVHAWDTLLPGERQKLLGRTELPCEYTAWCSAYSPYETVTRVIDVGHILNQAGLARATYAGLIRDVHGVPIDDIRRQCTNAITRCLYLPVGSSRLERVQLLTTLTRWAHQYAPLYDGSHLPIRD